MSKQSVHDRVVDLSTLLRMSAVVNHLSINFLRQLVHIIGIIFNRNRVIAAPGPPPTLERASGGSPGRVTVSIDTLAVKEVATRFGSIPWKQDKRHVMSEVLF